MFWFTLILQVFDISSLQIFSPQELDYLICGRQEIWEVGLCSLYPSYSMLSIPLNKSWSLQPESLVDNIKFDHGYTAKSPAIVNVSASVLTCYVSQIQLLCSSLILYSCLQLLDIMAGFTPDQQHAFCQFVTGAPRLPPGGLAALSPKLTIVRKVYFLIYHDICYWNMCIVIPSDAVFWVTWCYF